MPTCAVCACECEKVCARCNANFYCSIEHQRQDWKHHKHDCIAFPSVGNSGKMRYTLSWFKNIIQRPPKSMFQKQCQLIELFGIMVGLRLKYTKASTLFDAIFLYLAKFGLTTRCDENKDKAEWERGFRRAERTNPGRNTRVFANYRQFGKLETLNEFIDFESPVTSQLQTTCDKMAKLQYVQLALNETQTKVRMVARRAFQKGDIVFQCATFIAASPDLQDCCYHCCVEFEDEPTLCRNICGLNYCSRECETKAFEMYHGPLCSSQMTVALQSYASECFTDRVMVPYRKMARGARTDIGMVSLLKYAFLLVKLYGMQLQCEEPIWETPPLCHFVPYIKLPKFNVFFAMVLYNLLATVFFLRPEARRVDPAWGLRTLQYILANGFSGGYTGVTIEPGKYDATSAIILPRQATYCEPSCTPNVEWKMSESLSEAFLVAKRDIANGESLSMLHADTVSQTRKHNVFCNFVCTCKECSTKK